MSTVNTQSQELAKSLWAIANELRGNMDASKFKDFILGVIFYRYLSEKTEKYMDDLLKDDGVTYREALEMEDMAPTVKEWSIEHLGYIIEPRDLWDSLILKMKGGIKKDAKDGDDKFSIEDFEKAITRLVQSTVGQESEAAFDKLFDDMNLQDKDLGKEVSDRSDLISKVMLRVNAIPFGADDAEVDVLGTAYMMLISLFASDAGKKGGEFFTPVCASKLLARLAMVGLKEVRNAADSCAGSGSLLLEVQNHLSTKRVGHFYATEKNGSNYNLLRMNLLMHGVPYKKFSCFNSDSIKKDNYYEDGEPVKFDIQVENPPYSAKYDQNARLLDDSRFSSCGVLPPQGKADLLFVESMVYHMAEDGRIAVLLPSGALFRGKKGKNGGKDDAEYKIRRYLIETLNVVDAIIGLPAKMFHGAKLPVIVMVLKKKRNGNSDNVLFIDASKHFTSEKTMNVITDEDIDRILDAYVNRSDIDEYSHVASMKEIEKNDFNCNIPRYVNSFKEEPEVDLDEQMRIISECDIKGKDLDEKLTVFLKELGLEDFSQELRFKADDGTDFPDWKTVTIKDLFSSVSDKKHPEETVLTIMQGHGTIPRESSDRNISYNKNSISTYKLVYPNDFIVHLRSFEGGLEIATLRGIVSPAYTILRNKIDFVPEFYRYYFRSQNFISMLAEITEGIRDGRSLNMEAFWELEVPYPSIEEQRKYGAFFSLLSTQEENEKTKLESLQNVKKGLLQRMFV